MAILFPSLTIMFSEPEVKRNNWLRVPNSWVLLDKTPWGIMRGGRLIVVGKRFCEKLAFAQPFCSFPLKPSRPQLLRQAFV